MLRHIFSAFTFALLAGPLAAQSDLPDRRIVVTNNMDFYGSDLTALFDTTFDACRTACLSNAQCQAFTYNAKSKACFPKSAVTQEVPYEGAYSARVLPTDSRVLAQAETRQADLEFLGDYTLGRAHELALKIGGMHPAGSWTTDAMMQAARDKEADGDYLNAMRWTGATVSVTDSADDWIEYARLSLAIEQDRSRYTNQAMQAATNGYFRALNDGASVNALLILGEVLERDGRGRDTVKALRLANDIQPRADVVAALGDAAGKYGFRITDNSADNESASPRICAQFPRI